MTVIDWSTVKDLGIKPDVEIGRRLGIDRRLVQQARIMGIFKEEQRDPKWKKWFFKNIKKFKVRAVLKRRTKFRIEQEVDHD